MTLLMSQNTKHDQVHIADSKKTFKEVNLQRVWKNFNPFEIRIYAEIKIFYKGPSKTIIVPLTFMCK